MRKIKTLKRQAKDWEKIFAKDRSDKGFLSKIYKELLTLRKATRLTTGQKT